MGDAPTPSNSHASSGSHLRLSLSEALPSAEARPPADGLSGLEISISRSDVPTAARILEAHGYRPFGTKADHRIYLSRSEGQWNRLLLAVDPSHRFHLLRSPVRRRSGLVIALVGPDGSGKGTVSTELADGQIPLVVRHRYFGSGASSGRQGDAGRDVARTPSPLRETAFVARKLARAIGLLAGAYAAARRGEVVLCDRHPVELLAIRPARHSRLASLVQRWGTRLLPRPDAIVVLDAPGDVLFDRKGEHSPELLNQWSEAFRTRLAGPRTTIVSSDQPMAATVAAVSTIVWKALARRHRW